MTGDEPPPVVWRGHRAVRTWALLAVRLETKGVSGKALNAVSRAWPSCR